MATYSSILAGKNPMDRGAWWALVHGVPKSQTGLYTLTTKMNVLGPSWAQKGFPPCSGLFHLGLVVICGRCCFCSVSVVSNTLGPHGLQHTRFPCPSLSPRTCSNSCPLSWWCYPTFSSCLQSFPAPESFPMSRLFSSSGQSIRASASSLPMNIQGWCLLGLTGLISLQSKGCSRVFSSTTVWKHQFFSAQPSLWSNSHICTWLL